MTFFKNLASNIKTRSYNLPNADWVNYSSNQSITDKAVCTDIILVFDPLKKNFTQLLYFGNRTPPRRNYLMYVEPLIHFQKLCFCQLLALHCNTIIVWCKSNIIKISWCDLLSQREKLKAKDITALVRRHSLSTLCFWHKSSTFKYMLKYLHKQTTFQKG